MIRINVLTIFPNLYSSMKIQTIVKKALDKGELELNIINIRNYTKNKHLKVDGYPYGGGEGMIMKIQPINDAILSNNLEKTRLLYTSPKGKHINQKMLYNLSKEKEITILVGRYEGVDERVFEKFSFEEISGGDYILTGGDLIAQVIIDGVTRLLPHVLNNSKSIINDTFTQELLEHPQYTRPQIFETYEVPEILMSGNHKKIEKWKLEQQIKETIEKRPDLYLKYLDRRKDK